MALPSHWAPAAQKPWLKGHTHRRTRSGSTPAAEEISVLGPPRTATRTCAAKRQIHFHRLPQSEEDKPAESPTSRPRAPTSSWLADGPADVSSARLRAEMSRLAVEMSSLMEGLASDRAPLLEPVRLFSRASPTRQRKAMQPPSPVSGQRRTAAAAWPPPSSPPAPAPLSPPAGKAPMVRRTLTPDAIYNLMI